VHNALIGFGVRKNIRILCSGKIVSGFDLISRLAVGADIGNSARAMMLALGCIQALRCNTNQCPTGVATQDPNLVAGLVPADKSVRVANYHKDTVKTVAELIGAMGIRHTNQLRPWNIMKRTGLAEVRNYEELYPFIEEGSLLGKSPPASYARPLAAARADSFDPA
jgi:glutamate synthase domain-containing protein 2